MEHREWTCELELSPDVDNSMTDAERDVMLRSEAVTAAVRYGLEESTIHRGSITWSRVNPASSSVPHKFTVSGMAYVVFPVTTASRNGR